MNPTRPAPERMTRMRGRTTLHPLVGMILLLSLSMTGAAQPVADGEPVVAEVAGEPTAAASAFSLPEPGGEEAVLPDAPADEGTGSLRDRLLALRARVARQQAGRQEAQTLPGPEPLASDTGALSVGSTLPVDPAEGIPSAPTSAVPSAEPAAPAAAALPADPVAPVSALHAAELPAITPAALPAEPVAPLPSVPAPEPSAAVPVVLPAEPAAPTASGALTLAQALQLALANNREIAGQRSTLAISREQVREARTRGVPTLNVQNLQTHVDRLTSLGPLTIGLHDTNITQVVLKHPLYTFGRIENGVRAAQEVSAAERLALQAKQADVALRVIQAFVQVLKKHNRATIAGETLAVLQRHLELTRTLFEAGVVLSTDVATTKVKVLEARQKLIEEENAWAIAREVLANLLVVPVATMGEPAGLAAGLLPGPICAPALVGGNVEDNPELRRFDGLLRGLDRKKRVERAGTLPTVGLQADWSTGNAYTEFYESWNAVVVVDLPLFEGGLARSRTQQVQHEIDRAVQGRELVRENLQLARQTSLLRLHEMEKKIALSEEAVKTARENLDQNELNYKEGTVLNTDVLEAQLLLNDAKVSLNNALFDYISWQAEHAKHVGRLGEFLRAVLGPAADSLPSL